MGALLAAPFSDCYASASEPKRPHRTALFSVTMVATLWGSLTYRERTTRDGCSSETTAGGAVRISLRSQRPAIATVVFRRGARGAQVLYLSGVFRALSATRAAEFENTVTNVSGCVDGRPPTQTITHCDAAPPARLSDVRAQFFDAGGTGPAIAFAAMRDARLDVEIPTCDVPGERPRERLGGIDLARGAFSPAKLLNRKGTKAVVDGRYVRSTPLAGVGVEGSVSRRISWALTFKRLQRRR